MPCKDTTSQIRITLDKKDITTLPMYKRARLGIGYLPQQPSIFRGLSVEDNIMLVLEMVEPLAAKREERLEQLLDEFSIAHIRKSKAYTLSGGERRRVEIARCLVPNPISSRKSSKTSLISRN